MPNRPMTRRMGRGLVWLIIIGMFVQSCVILYVGVTAHEGRKSLKKAEHQSSFALTSASRRGCERNKLDRKDNADFQRAQAIYIHRVTSAKSVKEDVKQAARAAEKTFARTSASLSRRSKIDCKKAFP